MGNAKDRFKAMMGEKQFDVEHALTLYALSFYSLPAQNIYDSSLSETLGAGVNNCHIYMIGVIPKLELVGTRQQEQTLFLQFVCKGDNYEVQCPLPEGVTLRYDGDHWYLCDGSGQRFGPTMNQMIQMFQKQHGPVEFKVLYIGQAYGKEGTRNALDRLKSHKRLQEIALKGTPEGHTFQVLLLEIQPSTNTVTLFNPFAKDTSQGESRIDKGLNKLFGTDEHERITLYEASLIRYFQPHYNKQFKSSFPSTNLRVLRGCYDKDFASLVAEICFDEPPYLLYSDAVAPQLSHTIVHNLHDEEERRVFFTGTDKHIV